MTLNNNITQARCAGVKSIGKLDWIGQRGRKLQRYFGFHSALSDSSAAPNRTASGSTALAATRSREGRRPPTDRSSMARAHFVSRGPGPQNSSLLIRRSVAAFLAALVLCMGTAAAADDSSKHFEINAKPLADALMEFGVQSGLTVVAPTTLTAGKKAAAVRGDLAPTDALGRLLKGSGLTFSRAADGTIAIQAVASNGPVQASAGESGLDTNLTDSASLTEVVVTGKYRFLDADTSGTTGLPVPIEKVPQSISLVSQDFLKAANLSNIAEIAEYTPGAINAGNQLGAGTIIKLRGFNAGVAIDGINVQGNLNVEPSDAIFDRLEIVKGPSSVVYGISSPGGLVNYVTKNASPTAKSYVYVDGGSFGEFHAEGQFATRLNSDGTINALLLAVQDQGNSYIDIINHNRTTLYSALNFDFDRLHVYLHDSIDVNRRTAFDGIPTEPDGSPAPVPRSFFIGDSNMNLIDHTYNVEAGVSWKPIDPLDLSLKGNYQHDNTEGYTPYPSGLATDGSYNLDIEDTPYDKTYNYGIGASATYHLDNLGMSDSFVSIGVLDQVFHSSSAVLYDTSSAVLNLADSYATVAQAAQNLLNGPLASTVGQSQIRTLTYSAQAIIKPIEPLSLLVGASSSRPEQWIVNNGVLADYQYNEQTSYRAGVTYNVIDDTNIYFSYSQSFLPQAYNSISAAGVVGVVPPLTGDQYEAGVKYKTIGGGLLLTAAAFRINQRNEAEYAQTVDGTDYFSPIGEVRNQGFELAALGQITKNWQINAGYSYLDAKVIADSDATSIGKRELYLPQSTASLFTTYNFTEKGLKGVFIGGGMRYSADVLTSYDGSTKPIHGYALFDLTGGYDIQKWRFQLNLRNITDKSYFINNYQTLYYGNTPGEPRSIFASLRREF